MRCYRVSSRALGHRVTIHVHIHDGQAEMVRAAEAFNGDTFTERTQGITQMWASRDGRATQVLVHLHDDYLRHDVISHELMHAAHVLYGATLGDEELARVHLTHHNEPLAHLHTDLYSGLLWKLSGK